MARPKLLRSGEYLPRVKELCAIKPVAVGNSMGFRIRKDDFELHPDRLYKLTIEELSR